jgi:phosphatidylserine decarboxylase
VTRIQGDWKGNDFPYYIVQIAGWSVNGVDSYVTPGESLDKGEIFGLIRIGSQVDLVAPYFPQMEIRVKPGDKVRAGESILIA